MSSDELERFIIEETQKRIKAEKYGTKMLAARDKLQKEFDDNKMYALH